jgi:hypothetical protein
MEMIAHLHEVESGLFGAHGLTNEFLRAERFGHELVSDFHASTLRTRRSTAQRLRRAG